MLSFSTMYTWREDARPRVEDSPLLLGSKKAQSVVHDAPFMPRKKWAITPNLAPGCSSFVFLRGSLLRPPFLCFAAKSTLDFALHPLEASPSLLFVLHDEGTD